MTIDPAVVPGLLLLAAELAALAAVGYVIVRAVLRQDDERMALAQGLVVGPALWGVIVNFVLYVVPGLAGAALGWGVMLGVAAVLIWRAPSSIRPRPRTVAGFALAVLALVWAALATRQLIGILDPHTDLGLAASIRAGGFPPEPFWNPGMPAPYHHGSPLLAGLLSPPVGPDLAFVTELLGAYGWTSLVLIVTTALLQRASLFSVLVAAPLLLSPGLWTYFGVAPGVLQLPIPAGLPEAGLRASLADMYWPGVELAPKVDRTELLPDIWKPAFTLGYALAFVVLERAARFERGSWPAAMTLAGLVGFIGVLATTLAPVVLVLWAGLEAVRLVQSRRERSALAQRSGQTRGWLREMARGGVGGALVRACAGLALAALSLLGGGGVFTGLLDGAASSGLSLATSLHSEHWRLLGTFDRQPGGVALLGVGPVVVAGVAALLARRDRLVLALAAGAGLLALAWLALTYPPFPGDLHRLGGHARNLALAALLLALSARLSGLLSVRWRYVTGALLVGLIAWPTVVAPVRYLGLAVGNGVQLANANALHDEPREPDGPLIVRRYQLPAMSERLAAFLRDHTPLEARVLATERPYQNVVFATGRPNAAGFAGRLHLIYIVGPEYLDAVNYLEPRAFRQLGLKYVHATDAWRADLPDRAVRRLNDPRMFELLARDGGEALYRVRPAFLELDTAPHPASYEALRAVPPALTVYLTPHTSWWSWLRITSALPDSRLLGANHIWRLHLRTPQWPIEPLGTHVPDLVVLPANVDPWMFPAGLRPIWRNEDAMIYASPRAMSPIMTLPDIEPSPVSVRVTDAGLDRGRVTFTATYSERAPERWTSQDWVLVPLDETPLGIPTEFLPGERGPAFAKWFDGLVSSGGAASTHTYQLDVVAGSLAVRNDHGVFVPLPASEGSPDPGNWALVIRLRHEWQPNHWREAGFIPVLKLRVSDAGEIVFELYDQVRGS